MFRLEQFLQFLKGKSLLFKIVSIILFAILCFLFIEGCSYKLHADRIDNVTKSIEVKDIFDK